MYINFWRAVCIHYLGVLTLFAIELAFNKNISEALPVVK